MAQPPQFVDIDGDGDLDAFILGGYGDTLFYRNTGTVENPVFSAPVTNPFGFTDASGNKSLTLVDIDHDGDLDIFVGKNDGNTLFYLNTANDAPIATNLNQTIAYTEDTTAAIADIVITDPNPSNTFTATVTLAGGNSAIGALSANSGHGESYSAATGVWTVSGTLAAVNAALAALSFVPIANGFANTSASIAVSDGIAPALTGTLTFNGTAVNDAPKGSATAVLLAGTEDTAYTVIASNLLKGFSDIDGGSLQVTGLAANHGTVVNNNDGSYTLSPEANYNGKVDLTYKVSDGKGGSIAATQSFNLAAVNDAPKGSATAVLAEGTEDTAYSVSDGKGGSVAATQSFSLTAANDAPVLIAPAPINYVDTIKDDNFSLIVNLLAVSNAEHGALTYGIVGGIDNGDGTVSLSSAYGVLTVSSLTGAYAFSADDAAIEALKSKAASAVFSVTVTDGPLTDSETLTVNISQKDSTESAGNDKLTGTSENERFNALSGKDTVVGGAGNDKLTGGTGLDVFVFDTAAFANLDTLTDFVVADDTIQLENAMFSQLTTVGALKAINFVVATAAADASDFVIYNAASGALLYDADGGGANCRAGNQSGVDGGGFCSDLVVGGQVFCPLGWDGG